MEKEIEEIKQNIIDNRGNLGEVIGQVPISGNPITVKDLFDIMEEQCDRIKELEGGIDMALGGLIVCAPNGAENKLYKHLYNLRQS